MKIKAATPSSVPKLIFILLGVMVLLALIPYLLSSKKETPKSYQLESELPAGMIDFMNKKSTMPEVLDFFQEFTIYLGVFGDASRKLPAEIKEQVEAIGGIELGKIKLKEPYVGIIENGKFIAEKKDDKSKVSLSHQGNEIISGRNGNKRFCSLTTSNKVYEVSDRGLNLFIQDKEGIIIGTYAFDYYEEATPKSVCKKENIAYAKLPQIEIVIKEKNYQKLKEKRDVAFKQKILMTGDEDLVKAKINYGEQSFKSRIRLKGDWADHLRGENWSFRVKLETGSALLGMRKFSLHRPEARNYVGEWLFHEILKEEGLINMQYRFVQVLLTIQGAEGDTQKVLGMYALEEAFDKQVIERNQRREGIILKIDEDPLWEERVNLVNSMGFGRLNDLEYIKISDFENMNIVAFGESRIKKDSVLFAQFKIGRSLLKSYIDGERPMRDIFDLEKLAKYNALCNYLSAGHALVPNNYRFYYDPISSRLEPIGFDGNAFYNRFDFFTYLHGFENLEYMEAYVAALEEVTDPAFAEKILSWPGLEEQIRMMQKSYPEYKFAKEILDDNRFAIQSFLKPVRTINVYLEEMTDDYLRLNIENFGKFPVEIKSLENAGNRIFAQAYGTTIVQPNERATIAFQLDENYQRLFINKKKKKSKFDLQKDLEKVKVLFNVYGAKTVLQEKIMTWTHKDMAAQSILKENSTVANYDFLEVNEQAKTINCKVGKWEIHKHLIIPPGYVFKVHGGTTIELHNFRSKIISYSPVEFIGTDDEPVEFTTRLTGQGLMVLDTKDTSYIHNCKFTNLHNPTSNGWAISGAVNFYRAPVKMSNTLISDNHCEDALNIIKTSFELDNLIFTNIQSDAFDGDFVKGIVKNCMFSEIGNDAIDVSGSNIEVDNVTITNAGDKGLSAGEGSEMLAHNILIKNCEIALASKDQSTLKIFDAILEHNKLAFTAYQKKPEYGVAFMEADSIKMVENQLEFLIEEGSALRLNGVLVPTVKLVKEKMYGAEFGKSSK